MIYTDRSRILAHQECPRRRFLEYHQGGRGIVSKSQPLPLAVGTSVHVGLGILLEHCVGKTWKEVQRERAENDAVLGALASIRIEAAGGLELDLAERTAMGMENSKFDKYLVEEQVSLVEAIVRAYARRRLKPLLEQFEILEVECEGSWKLGEVAFAHGMEDIIFMSRPDALLRERDSNNLYIQSYKTTSSWDIRRQKDAEHDFQGLSEGIEIEKRLGQRIHAIRYEYLLKGDRGFDKNLTEEMQMDTRVQRSHLIRGYYNPGLTDTDAQWNWSWDFKKDDGSKSKLYYKTWAGEPVFRHMPIRQWIDMLDRSELIKFNEGFEGFERELGYKSDAQATGFTEEHPLDAVFVPPVIIYRNDDDLRDLVEQIEAQEIEVAENVARVDGAVSQGERRHLLNIYFRQHRSRCEWPSTCQFAKICYGGDEIRKDPMGSGVYVVRTPNHPQELK